MARVQFAVKMALARVLPGRNRCPYCESCLHYRLQRKWLLIEARKCAYCGLIFRYPTDDAGHTNEFYENGYSGQQATDLPDDSSLERLIETNFVDSPYDKSHRVEFLQSVSRTGQRVLDFGCAWGYSLPQLLQAGFDPVGFELAKNRAEFGRTRLKMTIYSDWESLLDESKRFDAIYTDHTLEHTPNLREPLERFAELLNPGGKLVIFVPNAGSLLGRQLGVGWGPFIGESHTIAFTDNWCAENLPRHGFQIERLFSTTTNGTSSLPDGEELVCVARRT